MAAHAATFVGTVIVVGIAKGRSAALVLSALLP
jgi:hypothetical protein